MPIACRITMKRPSSSRTPPSLRASASSCWRTPAATSAFWSRKRLHHRLRRRRTHDRRVLQRAREVQVVGAALADDDDMAGAVDLGVVAQRRIVADEVAAFDQHVRRRERDLGAALRVDREEADVGALVHDRVDRLGGAVDDDELERRRRAASRARRRGRR
jgi:hypothetical protein